MSEEQLDLTPGQFIKRVRRQMRLTQTEFSKVLEITQSHLCKIENDTAQVSLESWSRLCEHAQISLDIYRSLKTPELS